LCEAGASRAPLKENHHDNEQKKSLVAQTWAALGKGDIKTAFANMSDSVSWLVMTQDREMGQR
jgi:ketosteroid isomerase-like protein